MRILFVSTLYSRRGIGGAEKVVQALAEGLAKQGHECMVVTTTEGQPTKESLNGVQVFHVPVANLYPPHGQERPSQLHRARWHQKDDWNREMAHRFGQILDSEQPDIVNTHTIAGFSAAIWSATKSRRIPLVHTLHDQYLLCPRGSMRGRKGNCQSQCLECKILTFRRRAIGHAPDSIIGVSEFIVNRHREFGMFNDSECNAIYNSIPLSKGQSSACTNNRQTIVFGYQGRLDPNKGVDRLIDAMNELPPQKASLLIAGKGDPDYVHHLKARAGKNIEFLGFAPDGELYSQSDVLVVPSLWHDTAPLTVLEGMAAGLLVIGSNRGGIPELLSGVGIIFDPDDSRDLVRVLESVLENPQDMVQRKRRARNRALAFSEEKQIESYMEIFRALVANA